MRHFINRIKHLAMAGLCHAGRKIKMTEHVREDLRLCIEFLGDAKDGISMNRLTFRKPTHFFRSDACEHGIGGYNIMTGKAWRFPLPANCQLRATINVLEFFGCLVTIWVDLLANEIPPESCILSQTDSTSAAGWMHKSSFNDKQHLLAMTAARHLARLIMSSKTCLYSQWIQGEYNGVSDMLSRQENF